MKYTSFIKQAYSTLVPDSKYKSNWHIRVIADRLQAAYDGKITRLIINVPPRFMKSICVSVAWPAWIIGLNPCARIIVASYSQILSEKLSLDTRCIIQSQWYRKIFPEVEILNVQNTKRKFQTTKLGFRFATSVGGSLTGEGGNFLIVDDPMNPQQASSMSYRKKVFDWFNQTFITRLNDRKKGIVVVVMHRLHTEDLVGQILSSHTAKKWHVLSIPLINEKRRRFYFLSNSKAGERKTLYIRESDEPLIKNMSKRFIENIKSEVGTYAYASQYQQNPINLTKNGCLIKYSWFRRYVDSEYNRNTYSIIQSWDTATTERLSSSFSVCTTWAVGEGALYLLEVYRKRVGYSTLKKDFLQITDKWNPNSIIIEERSSGYQLINEFENRFPIFPFTPSSSKLRRVMKCIPYIQAGFLFLPLYASWLYDFERELCSFPLSSEHVDQVDSMSQALLWVRENMITDTSSQPQLREV